MQYYSIKNKLLNLLMDPTLYTDPNTPHGSGGRQVNGSQTKTRVLIGSAYEPNVHMIVCWNTMKR